LEWQVEKGIINMSLGLVYKNNGKIFNEVFDDTPFLEFRDLKKTGFVKHGFSTRLGGVSQGDYESLNLSFGKGDGFHEVTKNFIKIGRAMDIQIKDMVFSKQTHSTNIKVVGREDKGNGITKVQKFKEVDGLITNEPGVCLVTFYADCVPLYFVDPVNKAIGLSHSGWRGTASKMAVKTLNLMAGKFGTNPRYVKVAIGPSICQGCYEVNEDVVDEIRKHFPRETWGEIYIKKENGKYLLDLWKVNELLLHDAGVLFSNIEVTNLCTCCNDNLFFSHRAMGDKRGTMAAFLMIKELRDMREGY
jgi:YfiH family protein